MCRIIISDPADEQPNEHIRKEKDEFDFISMKMSKTDAMMLKQHIRAKEYWRENANCFAIPLFSLHLSND